MAAFTGLAATLRASGRVGAGPFIKASVAVAYDQPGRAISDNFIGLSYEFAVLASPEQLSPGNLSIRGVLRGLGPGGVLRLGGKSSERTVWRDTGDRSEVESFVITPARGAALLPARLVAPGLNMAVYATRGADSTLKVCLINKDLERGARVGIEAGREFPSASLLRLAAPSADARTDVTFGGSAVDGFGHWSPQPPKVFPWRSDSFVEVPAASAVIVQLSPR